MDHEPKTKITLVSQLNAEKKTISENGFDFSQKDSNKQLSSKLFAKMEENLKKQIPKHKQEQDKIKFAEYFDPNTAMLNLKLEYHFNPNGDFDQDGISESQAEILINVFRAICNAYNDLGGEIHKAKFYSKEIELHSEHEFTYKLRNKLEVEQAECYVSDVFSKVKTHEVLLLEIAGFEIKVEVFPNLNVPFVSDELLTVTRVVDGFRSGRGIVYLMDPITGKSFAYKCNNKYLPTLRDLSCTEKKVRIKYRPDLKYELGEIIECGGYIEEVYDIEESASIC